ncbi:MAG: asparagine synthase (glutamine-hydrolyzing), partial [Bdellovibrionales bacterium]
MCGIGGAIERELAYPSNYEPLLSLILKHQQPRGPDHAARVEISREKLSISLTHNRLAILDLTDDSNQPLIDPETGSCIVFNGEIYNFIELRQELQALGVRFFTQGDTEVLLKVYLQWGKAGLNKLNGMFAFAIWDPRHQKLILARDRFGVKPCYYLNNPVRFAFASTTTALAKFFEADHSMAYLARGVTYNLYEADSDSSPFANIHSLAPGHILEVSLDSVRAEPFYSLESEVQQEREKLAGMSDLQLIARLEDLLHSAVHLRLRSDVPVTISLSGGLDSALLASFMIQESNRPDIAFTLGKPGDRGGEADLALRSAKHLGLGLRFVEIDADKICDLFERTLTAQGAPFAHPSVMSQNRVFEEMSTHGFRVSIGGQGADEVFLGYRKFQFFHLRELLLRQE